jgi:hypothetical protein
MEKYSIRQLRRLKNGSMEGRGRSQWSRGGFVNPVADLHHFHEEQEPDPDPHQSDKSEPDPHQSEKIDSDPHLQH